MRRPSDSFVLLASDSAIHRGSDCGSGGATSFPSLDTELNDDVLLARISDDDPLGTRRSDGDALDPDASRAALDTLRSEAELGSGGSEEKDWARDEDD